MSSESVFNRVVNGDTTSFEREDTTAKWEKIKAKLEADRQLTTG